MKDEYRFIRVIGEGAFSRVYLAEGRNGQRYACKVGREVKMLRREAEVLSRLYYPLFPAYVDYEEKEGEGWLVMEYISGRNLGQLARLRGGISPRQAMGIAMELTEGLRYLHERQPAILYRDLKPENIMVCQDGHIKLIDFGCACCQDAQHGARAGTPGFAPPEQLTEGGIAGIYSDVYGLGRTIQRVLKMEEIQYCNGKGRLHSGERKHRKNGAGYHNEPDKCHGEERKYRRRLERMVEEATREDARQRPQDMIVISHILTGKRKRKEGIICEKNIWESNYKNSCSLPLI